jgi:hypothetical protein
LATAATTRSAASARPDASARRKAPSLVS